MYHYKSVIETGLLAMDSGESHSTALCRILPPSFFGECKREGKWKIRLHPFEDQSLKEVKLSLLLFDMSAKHAPKDPGGLLEHRHATVSEHSTTEVPFAGCTAFSVHFQTHPSII